MPRPKGSKDLKPRLRRTNEQMKKDIIMNDSVAWETDKPNENSS